MAVNLSPVGGVAAQFFDNSGQVLTGGKLYSYLAGTTTPTVTYTTSTGITAQPNPIVLNAAGRVPDSGEIWLVDGISYKFVLKDQNDVLIATYDNVIGINSSFINFTGQEETQIATQGQTVFTLTTLNYQPATNNLLVFVNGSKQIPTINFIETSSTIVTFVDGLNVGDIVDFSTATPINTSTTTANSVSFTGFKGQTGNVQNLADDDGSDWVGFLPKNVNAVSRSAQDKLREVVSVLDFGADPTGVADSTSAFNNALAAASSVHVPAGIYKVTSITHPTDHTTVLYGDSRESSIINGSGNYVLTYGTGAFEDSRFSILQNITVNAVTTGKTALKVANGGIHIFNCYFNTTAYALNAGVGIELNFAISVTWKNISANGATYGIYCNREFSSEYIYLCTFELVSVSGNTTGKGLYVKDATNGNGYMSSCTFTNFNAEVCSSGINFDTNTGFKNLFLNLWAENCSQYFIDEGTTTSNSTFNRYINYSYYGTTPANSSIWSNNSAYSVGFDGTYTKYNYGSVRTDFLGQARLEGPNLFHSVVDSTVPTNNVALSQSASAVDTYLLAAVDNGNAANKKLKITGLSVEVQTFNTNSFILSGYGAGTLTTNSNGAVSATSDERRKTDITPFTLGSDAIAKITPITHKWDDESGLNDGNFYTGFSAQNVLNAIPQAVFKDKDGFYSLDLKPIVAALVNTVNELKAEIDTLKAK